MLANEWHYCNDLQFFFGLKTALAIIALSFVTFTFSPVSLNLHPPRPEMGSYEQFSWTCRSFTENFRWLIKTGDTNLWLNLFSFVWRYFLHLWRQKHSQKNRKHISCQIQSQVFLASAVELWSWKVEFFPLNFWSLWNFLKSINHYWSYEMDTDEYDLLDLKMVCYLLESGTDENLEETLSSLRERHSDRLRNKMVAKFRIDRSSLARDDFADVLINEVISNKVLSYSVSDSNSKLKVIGAKYVLKILYLIKWYGTWEPQFIFLLHQNVLMYQLLHSFRSFKTISQTWSDMSSEPD